MASPKVATFQVIDGGRSDRKPRTYRAHGMLIGDGGGGGGGSDMEERVKRLEDDLRETRAGLTDIKVTLSRIETELKHKISYKWLTVYVLGLAALILRSEIASLFQGAS